MTKTKVIGGKDQVEAAIDTIIAGATPNIKLIVQIEKGTWIILHTV